LRGTRPSHTGNLSETFFTTRTGKHSETVFGNTCQHTWENGIYTVALQSKYTRALTLEGYGAVTYRRFEARNVSALVNISPEDGSYTYRQWHEAAQVYATSSCVCVCVCVLTFERCTGE